MCRETAQSSEENASQPVNENEKGEADTEEKSDSLFESFATGDLLILAVAALLTQNGAPDNELLIILLLLLLGG